MFIDDDEAFLLFMQQCCKKVPSVSSVVVAHHGQEAIDILKNLVQEKSSLPNFLFIDINMPVMDGFQFLSHLFKLRVEFPILNEIHPLIMLTSSSEQRDRDKASGLGVNDYIIKPDGLAAARELIARLTQ